MSPLIPTTYGEVFVESLDDILGGKQPSHLLPSKHPFRFLWQDTLSKLTSNSTQSEIIIDSYISVFVQDPHWKSTLSVLRIAERRKEMITLLQDHPPDVVVLEQPMDHGYGLHIRRPGMWSFICITEYWVQRWLRVVECEPGERLALALETILRATIGHELGHWMTTLTVGPWSTDLLEAEKCGRFNAETCAKISREFSTPQTMCETWNTEKGKAGNFVEIAAMGGIVGFHTARGDVYIQIDETQCWSPSTAFLKLVCEYGTYHFVPGDGDVLLMGSKPELPPSPSRPRSFLSTNGQCGTDPSYALNCLVNQPNPSSIIR